jgi:hypothetical protein
MKLEYNTIFYIIVFFIIFYFALALLLSVYDININKYYSYTFFCAFILLSLIVFKKD